MSPLPTTITDHLPSIRTHLSDTTQRLLAARISYNYCGICGHVPRTKNDEPNRAPLRWWDCDDGWKIGTLCPYCAEEALPVRPKPGDYALLSTNGVCDDENTDEDPMDAL